MKTVLSTRTLSTGQRELLLGAGLGLVQYDAIRTEALEFETPSFGHSFIFTSNRAVEYFFAKVEGAVRSTACYCVGETTAQNLIKKGQKVVEIAQNGLELGQKIAKSHKKESFVYICGEQRLDTLPNFLKAQDITFIELPIYRTRAVSKTFDKQFDAILLFSPSSVRSCFEANTPGDAWLICIGDTTAEEARKYSNKIAVANSTRIESVIAKAVNTIKL